MPHRIEDFVGAWSLVDWRIEYDDGGITRPFGAAPRGYIVYSDNGIMIANIAGAERAAFGIPNARNADVECKAEAFDSYFAYAGPWRVEGDEVVHAVTLSQFPDMTGTEQRRLAVFDGQGGLTLSAHEPSRDDMSRHHILQWKRS